VDAKQPHFHKSLLPTYDVFADPKHPTTRSFLSGTFYSAKALPPAFQILTHYNPVFYLIDMARFGFLGVSDASPWHGLAVICAALVLVLGLGWYWLRIGYRMKP